MLGIPISAFALIPGLLFATRYASRTFIDPNPGTTEEIIENRLQDAPGAVRSSLPVIVPIFLIVLKSVATSFGEVLQRDVFAVLSFLGEPVIALLIGSFLAVALPKKLLPEMLSSDGWIGKSIKDAASILLITGAGGIFGKILQNSGIANTLGESVTGLHLGIWLPFFLAAVIKTA